MADHLPQTATAVDTTVGKFLGVDIDGIIGRAFKGKTSKATLTKFTTGKRTGTNLAGGTNDTPVKFKAEGFASEYKQHFIDGTTIKKGDRKVLLFGTLIEKLTVPEPGDHITIEGVEYRIQAQGVTRDPAKATYTCHCRAI